MLTATLAKEPIEIPLDKVLPTERNIRLQTISRHESKDDWPFTVDQGYLVCFPSIVGKIVVFTEITNDEEASTRYAQVSTNPVDIFSASMESGGLVDGSLGFEELIRRMAPIYATGKRLCAQEPGSVTGPGEL